MNRHKTVREQADRLFALLRHALRFWGTGLLIFVLGACASAIFAITRPRVYRSEALIQYQERISAGAIGREEGTSARRIGLRLRELVLSRSHLEELIKDFDLYPQVVEERGMAEAVELMRTKVLFRAREGDTYSLMFEGENPELVQKVTQRLTQALVSENRRSALQVAAGTKEFLDAEAQRIEEELKKREARLAKFLSEHPAFAAEAARATAGGTSVAGMTVTDPRKAAVVAPRRRSGDPRLDALEREADRIQARLAPPPPGPTPLSVQDKEAIDEWNRRKSEAGQKLELALRDLQEKRQSLTDEHPDVKQAKGRVEMARRYQEEVQAQAARETERIRQKAQAALQPLTPEDRARLQTELERVQQELQRYRASHRVAESAKEKEADKDAASAEADNIVKLETSWVQLSREVAEWQQQRRKVEEQRFAAETQARMQTEGGAAMQVVDEANRPTKPIRGGRTQAAAIGGVATVALALLLMLLRALLDDRVYDRNDIARLEVAPLLTVVPRRSGKQAPAAPRTLPPSRQLGARQDPDRQAAHG